MAATPASEYERILGQQLAMNRHTWITLQEHGVTEATELRLDFAFRAPNREAAERLAALLKEQTDYASAQGANGLRCGR